MATPNYPLSTSSPSHYSACRLSQRFFCASCVRRAALRHVAIAATTRAQLLYGLFHQGTHIMGEPCRLSEDQRRLSASTAQQSDCVSGLRKPLCQHLDEVKVAVRKKPHHKLAAAVLIRRLQHLLRL